MITKYIKGDICDTELQYIAHGVNCKGVMGAGVAKALYERFPVVKTRYQDYLRHECEGLTPSEHLGTLCTAYDEKSHKRIINLFTQLKYGKPVRVYVSYTAMVSCFRRLVEILPPGEKIAIPKIGCGLAGGNWYIVEKLINHTVGDKLEIWVYEL